MSTVRVLVVDDYEPFRRFICSTLGTKTELQVVGEASDGLEAVRKAEELRPDLIVLDIGLPGQNGMDAARRIRKLSSKSKILFLSQESAAAVVQEALRLGAMGYVVKAHAGSELLIAVAAVCEGRQFVSRGVSGHEGDRDAEAYMQALPSPVRTRSEITGSHEVEFYSDDAAFLVRLALSIEGDLAGGSAVIVFATESHRKGIVLRLQADGVDSSAAVGQGRLILLDAAEMLSEFMEDTGLHRERFLSITVPLLRDAETKHKTVMVYGEMVAVLFAEGKVKAALELEKLWNELARTHIFQLRCAYPMSEELRGEPFGAICAEHSSVLSA